MPNPVLKCLGHPLLRRLVREMDQKAAWLLELVLLDRASAQQATGCRSMAVSKFRAGVAALVAQRLGWLGYRR